MRILVYHGIVKKLDNFDKFFQKHILIDDFKKQVNFIRKKYKVLSLEEFHDKWRKRKLKNNELLIFFDDCYKNALNGARILEEFKIPAIFAISSDLINKGYFWGDDIEKVLIHTRKKTIKFNKSPFDVSTEIKKFNAILSLKKYFKNISTDIIPKKLKDLAVTCKINPREIIQEKFKIISWNEIRQIKSVGFFSVVHHGHLHYPLSKFPSKEKFSQDVRINVEILRKKAKVDPYAFVYPFGEKGDYNDTAREILKNYGFKFGFTAEGKAVDYKDPFDIPRQYAMNRMKKNRPKIKPTVNKSVDWNITPVCNYNCSYCLNKRIEPTGNYPDPYTFLDKFAKNLSGSWNFYLAGSGEPFMAPDFFKITRELTKMGHKIELVSNFSASSKEILKFCRIAGKKLLHFNASLHLEFANPAKFLKKALLIKQVIGNKFSVLSVARPGRIFKLRKIAQNFRNQGIHFSMQLERNYSKGNQEPYVKYSKEELNIIKDFRKNFYHKDLLRFKGKLCWAGSKYFSLNEKGEAWRCISAWRHEDKEGYLGNLFQGTFKLKKEPTVCRYEYCVCINPIVLGMVVNNLKL